jgi:aminotransferase
MINLFQPSTGEAELDAIRDVLRSNWLGAGEQAERFEQAFAAYIGRPSAELLSVSSCTEGLFQTVAALGIGAGDEVILPTVSFLGAAHAVRCAGAQVVLCDVDRETLNPGVEHVQRVISSSTRAVLLLHYGGEPGFVAEIAELTAEREILLIEDAACGLGSQAGRHACGTLGDAGIWSFDAVKLLTTGDGGMIRCRDLELAERIRRGIRLGVGSSGLQRRAGSARWWEIDPDSTGRRATMNDISAAMGLAQLEKVPRFLRRRAEVAAVYEAALAELPWASAPERRTPDSVRFYYWIQTAPELRDRLAEHLLERDVYTNFRYWPLHRTRMYGGGGNFPGADSAAASTLLLPVHQGLADREVERVVEALRAFDA